MNNSEAYFILNLLPGIGPIKVKQLCSLLGDASNIFNASKNDLLKVSGIGVKLLNILQNWQNYCDPDKEREMAERGGVQIVTRADDAYPKLLQEIADPPHCLYVLGSSDCLMQYQQSLAIVGSRRTTNYGVRVAERLASSAAMTGWTVVSGLARGIDTVAHEATLRMNGKTIAVLGSGLGHIYPQENVGLAQSIAASGGCVISEMPMLTRPDKRGFPMRNRIISGMTKGTIVVEAGLRSGSLITARLALEQNRVVFAVPGRVDSPQSQGCHKLLKDGAVLIENFDDVLEDFLTLPGLFKRPSKGVAKEEVKQEALKNNTSNITLSVVEQQLYDLIGADEVLVDELLGELEASPAKVLSALVTLEMRRLIKQLPGKRVIRNITI